MKLSPHFLLEEFTTSQLASRYGWDNTPPESAIANLRRVAYLLEQVRTLLNEPIQITSGYRCLKVNEALGSKPTSQHTIGCAADFRGIRTSPYDICRAIILSNIKYDQLIYEFNSWVHISVPNSETDKHRMQKLIINRNGVQPFP